jgi:hypothetical protein
MRAYEEIIEFIAGGTTPGNALPFARRKRQKNELRS